MNTSSYTRREIIQRLLATLAVAPALAVPARASSLDTRPSRQMHELPPAPGMSVELHLV